MTPRWSGFAWLSAYSSQLQGWSQDEQGFDKAGAMAPWDLQAED